MPLNKFFIHIGGALTLISSLVALVITHDINSLISIFILGTIFNSLVVLSIFPFAGLIMQYVVAITVWDLLMPMLRILGIPSSIEWLANAVFWVPMIGGLIITIIIVGNLVSRSGGNIK